jgi:hypothetical protein
MVENNVKIYTSKELNDLGVFRQGKDSRIQCYNQGTPTRAIGSTIY